MVNEVSVLTATAGGKSTEVQIALLESSEAPELRSLQKPALLSLLMLRSTCESSWLPAPLSSSHFLTLSPYTEC